MDPNVNPDLAEDPGEKELKDIKAYQTIVSSLIYAALAIRPDISFAVAALCRYNSRPFTSPLTIPTEFSSISNPPPTFDSISAALAAMINSLAAMINSLATRTRIGPMIVATSNLMVVTSSFSATELSRGSNKSKISSPCQLSKPHTSLVLSGPVKQIDYSSATEIYMAKTHVCYRSTATIREHLVISQLGSYRLAPSRSTLAITIVKISMPAR
jgi:hypothetical protein